jgi:hypothetical protein
MNDADLIQAIGPAAYIEARAVAFDVLFPCAGLGDLLRDCYRLAVHAAAMSIAEISGAADELELYAETLQPSAHTPDSPKVSPRPAQPRESASEDKR